MNLLFFSEIQNRSAPLAAAPTISSSNFDFQNVGSSSQSFAPGVTWSSGQRLDTFINNSSSPTVSSVVGSTDDTGSLVDSVTNTPKTYYHTWTINSSLDATLDYTMSGSTRCVFAALAYSGATGITAVSKANSGTALLSPTVTVTGGPRNFLVVSCLCIAGLHRTNAPSPAGGWTAVGSETSTPSNNPTASSHSTLAIASRSYLDTDLSWSSGTATVPTMQWTATDYTSQNWNIITFGVLS